MSLRRALQVRIKTLDEMGGILNGMKTLALLETAKLERYLSTQQRVFHSLETIGATFVDAYPEMVRKTDPETSIYLVLGSERGFCGDYNERLASALARPAYTHAKLILIGQKLVSRLTGDPRIIASLDGPTVAEEVDTVITHIVSTLAELETRLPAFSLGILGHSATRGQTDSRSVLPPFQERHTRTPPSAGYPPRLNIAPQLFLEELLEHYLFAAIHTAFYAALMRENQQRMEHLDGAIQHLDKAIASLQLKNNHLRQEEITEELEEVLLAAESLPQTY